MQLVLLTALALAGVQQPPGEAPTDLVRQTVDNEIKSSADQARYMFRDRKQTAKGSQTKLMVQTSESMVGIIIANDDKALTPEQRKAEDGRVERFLTQPEELNKRKKQEAENAERITKIMKALPAAFLYEEDGSEPGKSGMGKLGHPLRRLKFYPNPGYSPPSRVEQVLTGMQGTLLIDLDEHRIAQIDGTLQKDVSFGWGILGHLDRGGHFFVQQGDVDNGHWEITRMELNFAGKLLLFKNLNIQMKETYSDFRKVPSGLTYAQGLELLRKQAPSIAENTPSGAR